MSTLNDQQYLCEQQYKDSTHLRARIRFYAQFSANPYGWSRWMFDQLDSVHGSRVLELGCGRGDLWAENRERIPNSWNVLLSDFSPGMLADAREHLGDFQSRFKFRLIDAQAIPFDDAAFDVVIANHMLFHVPDRPSALSEIHRVLKPGGRLYASTTGASHLQELFDLVRQFELAFLPFAASNPFTLENGMPQLARWFEDVTVRRYDDSLAVTQAAPLVDFVLSSSSASVSGLSERREAFIGFVEREMAARGGVIHIAKDSGLFIARRK